MSSPTTMMHAKSNEFGADALAPPVSTTVTEGDSRSTESASPVRGLGLGKCCSSFCAGLRETFKFPLSPFDELVEIDSTLISEIGEVAHEERGPYQVEDYKMKLEAFAEGCFGEVIEGWHSKTYKLNAIKKISKSKIEKEHSLEAVNREIGVLRHHSHHRNIIGFREVMHTSKNIYIVMEQATSNLHELSRSDDFGSQPDLIQQVAFGVLSGLNYLHERGVSHCDLYPRNILVRSKIGECIEARHVRLCGFGSALTAEEHSFLCESTPMSEDATSIFVEGQPLETSFYRAPEASGIERFDASLADIWSLGVSILEVTYDCLPDGFDKAAYSSNTSELEKILEPLKALVERSEGKRRAHDLLLKLLECDATKRVTAAQALQHLWFQYEYTY